MAIQKIPNTLIADNAVTAAKIANGSLTADDIAANSITAAKLSASTSPTFADLTTTGTINGLTLAAGSVATSTSQNFALNTPNSLRINIDSNNSNAGEIFAIGHNQTAVDASNNVLFLIQAVNARAGFNATSLNADLHIGSSNAVGDATNPALQIGGASTYRLGMYTGSEDAIIENKNGDDGIAFRVKTKGEAMRIDGGTGNVGIGTNNPDGLLHISSGTAGDAILILESDTDNNDEADNPQIWFKGDGDITKAAIRTTDNQLELISNVDAGNGIKFYVGGTNNTGTTDPGTSATERMRIDSSGDLLVGSSTNLNVLSGTPKIQVGNGSGHASIQWYSGAGSVAGLYFGDASAGSARYEGYIEYRHNNNQMAFRTQGTDRLFIDSSGPVTMPYQPAFHAYGPSAAVSTGNYVVYANTYVNTGSHYSTSNGRFTAPVAGVYLFFWSAIGNNTNDVYRWFLYKNGSVNAGGGNDIHLRQDTGATGSEYATNGSRVQMLSLSANDYVQIYFSADSNTSGYYQSDYVNFGGYLIG